MTRNTLFLSALVMSVLMLSACSDSSDESTTASRMTLNITDAPVDEADAVVVEFTSVTLKHADGDDIVFNFEDDPATTDVDESNKSIDLLSLQGIASQPLLENVEIPSGSYNQITLGVNAELDSVMDSYISIDTVQHELFIPSGSQTGLKLNTPFTVAAGTQGISVADEDSVYTIDFDLRKSIVDAVGRPGYFLKPVLRLVQNINTGSISGTVDLELLTGDNCSDEDPATGNAVYVFAEKGITPDDITSAEFDDTDIDPVTASLLSFDQDSGVYSYEVGYLAAGGFTVAFTCAADLDNDEDNSDVLFDAVGDVDIIGGENTDFPIEVPAI